MSITLLNILAGIGIGIVISLPLGPVALITMKRTAEHGLRAGVISGFAIALIDTVATVFILLGLHHSQHTFHNIPEWLFIVGSVIVFFYGLRILVADPLKTIERDLPWHKHFIASIILALTNPSTYLAFGVIGLFLTRFIDRPLFTRAQVAIGFFIGAFLWWSVLAYVAFTQRKRYEKAVLLNKVIGVLIMVLAVLALLHNFTSPHAPFFIHIPLSL
ncbi:MAG TPA: LysE family transporter [Candidatus Paceibacterota bacterium]|jgi:threonine/homoserine/homoserine lactone efflux protein|nr:LysE family transporter [Candidatus Paceibacterota bacterium]